MIRERVRVRYCLGDVGTGRSGRNTKSSRDLQSGASSSQLTGTVQEYGIATTSVHNKSRTHRRVSLKIFRTRGDSRYHVNQQLEYSVNDKREHSFNINVNNNSDTRAN
jgi:hypothetical protein